MHLLLKAMNISLTIARCDDPYLVSAISKINRKSLGDRWNTTDHRRILISNDHYTHVYRSLITNPRYSAVVSSLVSASAGAAVSSAPSAASSAFSARVAATFAMLSVGLVMSVKFGGSWTSSACNMESISVSEEISTAIESTTALAL